MEIKIYNKIIFNRIKLNNKIILKLLIIIYINNKERKKEIF